MRCSKSKKPGWVFLTLLWGMSLLLFSVPPAVAQEPPENIEAQIPELINHLKSKDESLRVEASNKLAAIGKPAVPALIGVLTEKESAPVAIFILGRIGVGAKEAIPTLSKTLKQHEDKNIRARAAEALGKIGPETFLLIVPGLKDKEAVVRLRSVQALGRIGPPAEPVLSAVVDRLQDEDEGVRTEAQKAVERIGKAQQ